MRYRYIIQNKSQFFFIVKNIVFIKHLNSTKNMYVYFWNCRRKIIILLLKKVVSKKS